MGRRVVSLLPSTTETVAALGHDAELVGRSHECDFPPEVADLPVVSRPRLTPVAASADIHRGVTDLLRDALSIYEVDPGALREARPDLIITQNLCRVCAVAEDEVVEAARTHLGGGVDVMSSSPMTMEEVFADILRVADALDDRAARARRGRRRPRHARFGGRADHDGQRRGPRARRPRGDPRRPVRIRPRSGPCGARGARRGPGVGSAVRRPGGAGRLRRRVGVLQPPRAEAGHLRGDRCGRDHGVGPAVALEGTAWQRW